MYVFNQKAICVERKKVTSIDVQLLIMNSTLTRTKDMLVLYINWLGPRFLKTAFYQHRVTGPLGCGRQIALVLV